MSIWTGTKKRASAGELTHGVARLLGLHHSIPAKASLHARLHGRHHLRLWLELRLLRLLPARHLRHHRARRVARWDVASQARLSRDKRVQKLLIDGNGCDRGARSIVSG